MKLIEDCPGIEGPIHAAVADAFGREDEAKLVDELRRDGDLVISLAAECDGAICGHVALSRMLSPPGALALGPVAVRKAMQGRGIGSAMVREAIGRARVLCCDIVFVLGAPRLYERFGFSGKAAKAFPSRYSGPAFMALHLAPERVPPAPAVYASAFGKLEGPSGDRGI